MSECWCFDDATANEGETPVNEMMQVQQDAAEVQQMRDRLANFGAFAPEGYAPALRTIDRLTAEVSALRDACRAALKETAWLMQYTTDRERYQKLYRQLNAALDGEVQP
jgi:hypothetical protein